VFGKSHWLLVWTVSSAGARQSAATVCATQSGSVMLLPRLLSDCETFVLGGAAAAEVNATKAHAPMGRNMEMLISQGQGPRGKFLSLVAMGLH